jgi:membrane-associated protease RseP (regulator of RpoE activity)
LRRLLPRFRLPTHPLFHLSLLATTLATTTLFGGWFFSGFPQDPYWENLRLAARHAAVWRLGLQFSVPLLVILGVHELGHMVACRYYGLPATYPYFIPAPLGIGTFGALIRIRAPITEKKILFDVGAAGPLAGFAAALPFLFWGVASSSVTTLRPSGTYLEFGEPPLFRWVEHLLLPATRSGGDAILAPFGFAAWFGLFVTALNLLPLAQLDGGHILYAVAGRRQRPIALVLFAVLAALSLLWPGWGLWAVIVLVMGIAHPPTADESRPLDGKRKILAAGCLAVFLLCFTPVPVRIVTNPHPAPKPAPSAPKTYDL